MINWDSILSSFNEKGTLLKWLKEVEKALRNGSLANVTITTISETTFKLKFIFADSTFIESDILTLPTGSKLDAFDLLALIKPSAGIIADISEDNTQVELHLDQTFIDKVDNLETTKEDYKGLVLKEGLESIIDKKSFYKYFFDKRNLPTQNYIIEGGTEQTPTNENVITALGGYPIGFKRKAHWFILVNFIGNTNNHYSNGFTLELLLRGSVDTDFYKMYIHSYNGTNDTFDSGFTSLKGLPRATSTSFGAVKAVGKADDMTQPIGIDNLGFLWTKAGGGGTFNKIWAGNMNGTINPVQITINQEQNNNIFKSPFIMIKYTCYLGGGQFNSRYAVIPIVVESGIINNTNIGSDTIFFKQDNTFKVGIYTFNVTLASTSAKYISIKVNQGGFKYDASTKEISETYIKDTFTIQELYVLS